MHLFAKWSIIRIRKVLADPVDPLVAPFSPWRVLLHILDHSPLSRAQILQVMNLNPSV